jgi:predicted metal-dependent phosphoesterase TrpH
VTDARAFADFHIHTRFSPDSRLDEDRLIELAITRGLTHIAVTDHNTVAGAEAVRDRVEVLGVGDRLRVIIGEEVSSADGEIVGVFLERTIPRGMTAEETVDAIHQQGGLASIPHAYDPFRKHHITEDALNRLAATGRIDMIEVFNSRVTFSRHNLQAAEFAAAHGLPTIACSDCHTGMEVAMSSNSLPPFETAAELRAGLGDNVWQGSRSTMFIHLATRYAVLSKRLGRALRSDGRDD